MTFDERMLSRYKLYTPEDQRPDDLYREVQALLTRLIAAEEVILDAEDNLGVVNPLLIDVWRLSAGLPASTL